MRDNPFEPPRAEVGDARAHAAPPTIVPILAVLCVLFMLAASAMAILVGTLIEAAIVVFFCAFLWFVPVGLLRGRPWAPAATVAAGLFVAVFAFGSLFVSAGQQDALALGFRVATGLFATLLAGTMLALRKHRYFGVVVISEEP